MTHQPFVPPQKAASAFNCPFCNAYANQEWSAGCRVIYDHSFVQGIEFCECKHCHRFSIWFQGAMIYPDLSQAPMANPDLPDEIKADYEEARSIINRSPRGAAALLRLCIQKLCAYLGEPGKNVNDDIAALVKKGLNPRIQKSLDIVRVIGNEAVHPGTIDLRDNPEIAVHLCKLLNLIADAMLTQPKEIESLYDVLPADKREQIDKRDGRK
jgi:Domain of unknown function (DUF4145)